MCACECGRVKFQFNLERNLERRREQFTIRGREELRIRVLERERRRFELEEEGGEIGFRREGRKEIKRQIGKKKRERKEKEKEKRKNVFFKILFFNFFF